MVRNGQGLAHQAELYTNTPFYCDGKLISVDFDLNPYVDRWYARHGIKRRC